MTASNGPVHFLPLIFTHAFSPTCCHPLVFTHLFSFKKLAKSKIVTPWCEWECHFHLLLKKVGKWYFHPYGGWKCKFHRPVVSENSAGVFADGSTKIAMWRTRKKQLWKKRPENQKEKTNVKCDWKGEKAITGWAQRWACSEAMGFRAK